ncbi:helix-hairpin-helix domain-containing protein [Streptomyces sp. NPDC051211]|uniref:helix-hairpin-helix domain-containing protein n=1 Tax=Streptomyces sp. NPDC051211 TaxID=3154643 RepID=UPI00344CAC52
MPTGLPAGGPPPTALRASEAAGTGPVPTGLPAGGARPVRPSAGARPARPPAGGARPAPLSAGGARPARPSPGGPAAAEQAPVPAPLTPAAAGRLALRERVPLWLQSRCGLEPRPLAAVGVLLVAAVGFAAQQYWSARPEPVTAPVAVVTPGPPGPPAVAPAGPVGPVGARIVVDVSGKVRDPGVRRLPAGSRVADALAAAGGVRPGTDTTGLNQARVLADGEQVLVGAPAPPPGPPPPLPGGTATAGAPLSLGSATVEQLDGLPGVGPVLAQHIVDFRTTRGGFRSVEDLRKVNGIGERRFADLRPLVRP